MFCKFCGAQIEDDSVFCDKCGKNVQEKIVRENVSKDKIISDNTKDQINEKIGTAKNVFRDKWSIVYGVFKEPATKIREFINSDEMVLSIVLIGIHAVLIGIVMRILSSNIEDIIPKLLRELINSRTLQTNKLIIGMIIIDIVINLLYAALAIGESYVLKQKMSIKKGIIIAGGRCIFVMPLFVLGIVFAIIGTPLAIVMIVLGCIISINYSRLVFTICYDSEQNEFKTFWINVATMSLFYVICVLIVYKFGSGYVDSVKSSIMDRLW